MGLAFTNYGVFFVSLTVGGSGTVNDWNPTGVAGVVVLYVRPDDFNDLTVTGLQGGEADRQIFIVNYGGPSAGDVIIKHASGSSSPANRFEIPGSADHTLGSKMAAGFQYHPGKSMWVCNMKDFG